MAGVLTSPTIELRRDPALPGLARVAAPERMLEVLREHLASVPPDERARWQTCVAREAVYEPGRECRIAYALGSDEPGRDELVYVRWDVQPRSHVSSSTLRIDGSCFEVFRYPRDRRMRSIRRMRRSDWLRTASEQWFRGRLGAGRFQPDSWRCTPIKYVPESRLICRLKGLWSAAGDDVWLRAYIRIARRNDALAQFDALREICDCLAACTNAPTAPMALGCLPAAHLFGTEFIRGETLRDAARIRGRDCLGEVCRQLAAISRCRPKLGTSKSTPADGVLARRMLNDLSVGHPAASSLCSALGKWAESPPPARSEPGLVHGDLHAGQVILKGTKTYVVDWEQAAISDPMRDITNLAAEYAAGENSFEAPSTPTETHLAAECVRAWRAAGGIWNAPAGRWWVTRALVLRAWGLLRHLRPGWSRSTLQLLELAARVSERGIDWLD